MFFKIVLTLLSGTFLTTEAFAGKSCTYLYGCMDDGVSSALYEDLMLDNPKLRVAFLSNRVDQVTDMNSFDGIKISYEKTPMGRDLEIFDYSNSSDLRIRKLTLLVVSKKVLRIFDGCPVSKFIDRSYVYPLYYQRKSSLEESDINNIYESIAEVCGKEMSFFAEALYNSVGFILPWKYKKSLFNALSTQSEGAKIETLDSIKKKYSSILND